MILQPERAVVSEMNSSCLALEVRFLFVSGSQEEFIGVMPRPKKSTLL